MEVVELISISLGTTHTLLLAACISVASLPLLLDIVLAILFNAVLKTIYLTLTIEG